MITISNYRSSLSIGLRALCERLTTKGEGALLTWLADRLIGRVGEGLGAVSYTHLDVYKRQIIYYALKIEDDWFCILTANMTDLANLSKVILKILSFAKPGIF